MLHLPIWIKWDKWLVLFCREKNEKKEEEKNEQRLINVILLDVFLGQPSLPGRICSNTF